MDRYVYRYQVYIFPKGYNNLIASWHPASNPGFLGDVKLSYKLSTPDKVHI